ncbi:MAG: DUF6356 family protein [Beijerinckiaceae bacterium]
MIHVVREAFTRHPEAVGENYVEHFGVAMRYSLRLFGAAFAALVHAFLPFLFEKTASTAIKAMHAEMMNRGAPAPAPARIQAAE